MVNIVSILVNENNNLSGRGNVGWKYANVQIGLRKMIIAIRQVDTDITLFLSSTSVISDN